jgi:hypothetical protein
MGGVGCDNMTVILTCFLHGTTYAELADRCGQVAFQSEEDCLEELSDFLSTHTKAVVTCQEPMSGRDVANGDLRGRGVASSDDLELHPHLDSDSSTSSSYSNSSLKSSQQLSCTV